MKKYLLLGLLLATNSMLVANNPVANTTDRFAELAQLPKVELPAVHKAELEKFLAERCEKYDGTTVFGVSFTVEEIRSLYRVTGKAAESLDVYTMHDDTEMQLQMHALGDKTVLIICQNMDKKGPAATEKDGRALVIFELLKAFGQFMTGDHLVDFDKIADLQKHFNIMRLMTLRAEHYAIKHSANITDIEKGLKTLDFGKTITQALERETEEIVKSLNQFKSFAELQEALKGLEIAFAFAFPASYKAWQEGAERTALWETAEKRKNVLMQQYGEAAYLPHLFKDAEFQEAIQKLNAPFRPTVGERIAQVKECVGEQKA